MKHKLSISYNYLMKKILNERTFNMENNYDEIKKIIKNEVEIQKTNIKVYRPYYNGDFDIGSIFKDEYNLIVKQNANEEGPSLAVLSITLEYCNNTDLTLQYLLSSLNYKIPFTLNTTQTKELNKICTEIKNDFLTAIDFDHASYIEVIINEKKYYLSEKNKIIQELEKIINLNKYKSEIINIIDKQALNYYSNKINQ